jgi:hypothetical protein
MDTIKYDLSGIELLVEFDYYGGCEAVIDRLPEDCYPGEPPTVDLESITSQGVDVETDDIYIGQGDKQQTLSDAIIDYIIENINDIKGDECEDRY